MSTAFKPTFTRIKDTISTARRLPRLGKIRLGRKLRSQKTGKEYPEETPFFVVPQEVAAVYGSAPKELDVMFPVNDEEVVFPQQLEYYGSSRGLQCHGNKEMAQEKTENGKWVERQCPCDRLTSGECTERGHLLVLLPKVSVGGLYQIDTGSFHSIVDINSGIDYVRAMVGRIAMIPLKLRRVARDTHADGRKQTHYTLQVALDADIEGVNKLREDTTRVIQYAHYQLEGPALDNPASDPPDAIVDVEPMDTGEAQQAPALPQAGPQEQPPATPTRQPASPQQAPNVGDGVIVSEGIVGTYQPKSGTRPGKFVLHTDQGDVELVFWESSLVEGFGERSGPIRCTWELRISKKGYQSNTLIQPVEWLS